MFQLFTRPGNLTRGVLVPPGEDYIRRTFQERLSFLRTYYSEKAFFLPNDNLLVRLVSHEMGSMHTPYEVFVQSLSDRCDSITRRAQFTGPASFGKLQYGSFYGEGSYEIIIGDDADFDIQDFVVNWKQGTPVRVLTHAVSDFGLTLPNGKDNHFVDGLAVIYINIPMLMLQFRLFVEDQKRRQVSEGIEPIVTPKMFIYRYVLPGMMVSHLDHVMVNRLINRAFGAPMSEALTKSAFFQAEAGNREGSGIIGQVDKAQDLILDRLINGSLEIEQVLSSIFTITERSALELLQIPDMPTLQVWWSLILARLKHMQLLMYVSKQRGSGHNRMYTNRAVIELERLLSSHVLERQLPAELLERTILDIQSILDLAKR